MNSSKKFPGMSLLKSAMAFIYDHNYHCTATIPFLTHKHAQK